MQRGKGAGLRASSVRRWGQEAVRLLFRWEVQLNAPGDGAGEGMNKGTIEITKRRYLFRCRIGGMSLWREELGKRESQRFIGGEAEEEEWLRLGMMEIGDWRLEHVREMKRRS